MRKYSSKLYLFVMLTLVFSGCEKFLEVAPDERLEINSLDDINATIVGIYQNARGYRFTHYSSDDVTLTQNVFEKPEVVEDLYTWARTFRDENHQDAPSQYWMAAYGSISQANHALLAIDKYKPAPSEEGKLAALKGEALIARSYHHFMLANIFGKHYGQTASSDLAVPYVTKTETKLEVNYTRNTVEEVYNMAEKDLLEGIALMEANIGDMNKNKYRFTAASVYAFASRFYLFRRKNQQDLVACLINADKSIIAFGGLSVMRPWSDYAADSNGPVDVNQQEVGMVQESSTWTSFSYVYQSTLAIRSELSNNPFGYTDERLQISYNRGGDVFIPTFGFVYNSSNLNTSASDIFPLAEVILNMAEVFVYAGDLETAKLLMAKIGESAYSNYDETDLTTDALKAHYETTDEWEAWMNYILFERRVQLFLKGFRWFDLKRYGLDIVHTLDNGSTIRLSKKAPNGDYQIPTFAISSGMQPNP